MHLPKMPKTGGGGSVQKCLLYRPIIVMLLIICWTDTFVESAGRIPVPVTINKCCRIGEQMEQTDSRQCMLGGPIKWVPRVYITLKQKFFDPVGEAPRFFSFNERQLPKTCSQPELVLNDGRLAIFSNGSLFYSSKNQVINPQDYCIENDLALICYPQVQGADPLMAPAKKLSEVSKCCAPTLVYSIEQGKCVGVPKGHTVLGRRVVNSSVVDISYGFPKCNDNTEYRIVGKFEMDTFDETKGTVKLDTGKEFLPLDYCLEHTLDDLQINVNIFACADKLSNPESVLVENPVSISSDCYYFKFTTFFNIGNLGEIWERQRAGKTFFLQFLCFLGSFKGIL